MSHDRQLAEGDSEGTPIVLVTGSSGIVGAAVCSAATTGGWAVRGVDRTAGGWTHLVGDLRDDHVRRKALRGARAIVHVAALHAPHVGKADDGEFRAVNVAVTEALLAEAAAAGAHRFVYTSTTSVYGDALVPHDRAVWVDERLTPRPRDIYDETKLAAEVLVAASLLHPVVLRIARCFPEPLAVRARHRLYRGVDVADVAAAHVLALCKPHVSGVFNIAGPLLFQHGDIQELYRSARTVIKRRAPAVAAAFARRGLALPGRIDRIYDSSAARRLLGYEPTRDVRHLLETRPADGTRNPETGMLCGGPPL